MPTLITPFPRGTNDRDQSDFNRIHSSTRIKIEHAFGALTMRWRMMWKHMYMLDVERITKTIYTCCVLHNMCIDDDDIMTENEAREYDQFVEQTMRGLSDNTTTGTVEIIDQDNTTNTNTSNEPRDNSQRRALGLAVRQRLVETVVPRSSQRRQRLRRQQQSQTDAVVQ